MSNNKKYGIIVGITLTVIAIFVLIPFFMTVGYKNTAISQEERIYEDQSNISTIVQKRVDMLSQLVNAVNDSKDFENETLVKLTEARSLAQEGKVQESNLTLAAVAEAYPDIKTVDLYKDVMTSTTTVENQLNGARVALNKDIKSYNILNRKFPSSFFLDISGYEKVDFKMFESNETANNFNPAEDNLWVEEGKLIDSE